jgi:amino acid transporter
VIRQIKRFFLGAPLDSQSEKEERLNIPVGLAVFASDALSSSAYATDEILIALVGMISVTASTSMTEVSIDASNLYLCFPVALAIASLLGIVIFSYRQIIQAYPDGGGAYIVAKDNLGPACSLLAAASLLFDYILTVAVSVSAGVAAIMATFHARTFDQEVLEERSAVALSVAAIIALVLMNLRGIKENGRIVAIPAYVFIASMLALIFTGVFRSSVFAHPPPLTFHGVQIGVQHMAVGLMFLKAFAHGCAALTGIEAVSNGVKAFKEPSAQTANRTMVVMGGLLATIFIGLTYLAMVYQIVPVEGDTVVSQIARTILSGQDIFYYVVQWATMIILILAANTSFGGFPRLAMILASDGYMPRQMINLGDRLVYSNGIVLLGTLAAVFVVAFHANVHALMPMYAIGVFLSFTLAQLGMVVRSLRKPVAASDSTEARPAVDIKKVVANGLGAFATGSVCLLLCIEKFMAGAWLVLICLPLIIWFFCCISKHYRTSQRLLALAPGTYHPVKVEHTVLVLVAALNKSVLPALGYATSISKRVEAVHVELNPAATAQLKQDWEAWGSGIELVVLKSPHRSLSSTLLKYIDAVEARYDHDVVTIVIPEFISKKWWHHLLHNQSAITIKTMLLFRPGKVVTTVRYHLKE